MDVGVNASQQPISREKNLISFASPRLAIGAYVPKQAIQR
jgi:hypothetical protein